VPGERLLRHDRPPVGDGPGESAGRPGAADSDNSRLSGRLVDDPAGRCALAIGDAAKPRRQGAALTVGADAAFLPPGRDGWLSAGWHRQSLAAQVFAL